MTSSLTGSSTLAQVIAKLNEIIAKHDALEELTSTIDLDMMSVKSDTSKLKTRVTSNQQQYLGNVQFLQDISNVTAFVGGASVGKRLRYVLDQLKAELIVMINEMANTKRPVDLGTLGNEIQAAIALVDANVPDGIKLDYRFQDMEKQIGILQQKENQTLWIPYGMSIDAPTSLTIQAEKPDHAVFVSGDVTVVNENKKAAKDENLLKITGSITASGIVTLTGMPTESIKIWYPIEIKRSHFQDKDLWNILEIMQLSQASSGTSEEIESFMSYTRAQLIAMKGIDWNSEKNLSEAFELIKKTALAPKSLQIQTLGNNQMAIQFSYEDHPLLSHFILERWDDQTNTWVAYDGNEGIVTLPTS